MTIQKTILMAAILSGTMAHGEDDGCGSMEIFAWTYYAFSNRMDDATTVANWKDLGINAPLSPRVDGTTDKKAFRTFLDQCLASGVRPYVYDTRIADRDNIFRIIGEDGKGAEKYRQLVRAVVADWGDHPAVRGFYVADEPEAQDNAAVFLAARIQREEAPKLQPFLNLLPWFDWIGGRMGAKSLAEYLDRAKRESGLDYMGYDCYMQQQNGHAKADDDVYFDNLREWAEFGRRSGARWNTTLLCVPHYKYVLGSSDDFRWQISTAAAMGAKGISWFYPDTHIGLHENYRDAPIGPFGERTPTFGWMSTEMRGFLHQFSQEFLRLAWEAAFCVGKTYGGIPAFVATTDSAPGSDSELIDVQGENMLVSRLRDAKGEKYFAIVNLARRDPKDLSLVFAPGTAVEERGWNGWRPLVSPSDAVAAQEKRGPQSVWRPCSPGQLYLIRVRPRGESAAK